MIWYVGLSSGCWLDSSFPPHSAFPRAQVRLSHSMLVSPLSDPLLGIQPLQERNWELQMLLRPGYGVPRLSHLSHSIGKSTSEGHPRFERGSVSYLFMEARSWLKISVFQRPATHCDPFKTLVRSCDSSIQNSPLPSHFTSLKAKFHYNGEALSDLYSYYLIYFSLSPPIQSH